MIPNAVDLMNRCMVCLTEALEKSLNVYGLHLPKVKRLLPTNLPAVEANEQRLDNLFEFEDASVAVVDYESEYDEGDKLKYGRYLLRVSARYQNEGKEIPPLRMIVIYTADVNREQVRTEFDRTGYAIRIEPAFLSELNSEEIWTRLNTKVKNGEKLTDEELMEFIILPLSYKTRKKKQEILKESVELAKTVQDPKSSTFLLSGLLVFSDKIVDAETREKIERSIRMTQIEQMWWEKADKKYAEREKKLIAEQKAALQAKDKEMKAKDREMKAKDREMKAKDAALAEKDRENARTILHVVDSIIHNSRVALEEACRIAGFSALEYANAQTMLDQTNSMEVG